MGFSYSISIFILQMPFTYRLYATQFTRAIDENQTDKQKNQAFDGLRNFP